MPMDSAPVEIRTLVLNTCILWVLKGLIKPKDPHICESRDPWTLQEFGCMSAPTGTPPIRIKSTESLFPSSSKSSKIEHNRTLH